MHYVYILYSEKLDVYYKGSSTDVKERYKKHLEGKSRYTSRANDWTLVFVREFDNKTDALKNEKMLKRQSRRYILWILQQDYNIIEKHTF